MPKKTKLFIIDDDISTLDLMVMMLSDLPLDIKTFDDPQLALAEVIANPPEIVFLDYSMPTMNGKQFIIKMSENFLFKYSSVVLITGLNLSQGEITQLKTLGFSQVIQKPFTQPELVEVIESIKYLNHSRNKAS